LFLSWGVFGDGGESISRTWRLRWSNISKRPNSRKNTFGAIDDHPNVLFGLAANLFCSVTCRYGDLLEWPSD
jgi:hypothetical protein